MALNESSLININACLWSGCRTKVNQKKIYKRQRFQRLLALPLEISIKGKLRWQETKKGGFWMMTQAFKYEAVTTANRHIKSLKKLSHLYQVFAQHSKYLLK